MSQFLSRYLRSGCMYGTQQAVSKRLEIAWGMVLYLVSKCFDGRNNCPQNSMR